MTHPKFYSLSQVAASVLLLSVLTACGGGGGGDSPSTSSDTAAAEAERLRRNTSTSSGTTTPTTTTTTTTPTTSTGTGTTTTTPTTSTGTTTTTPTSETTTTTPTTTTPTVALAPAMSSDTTWPPAYSGAVYTAAGCSAALRGSNRTFDVGPDKTYKELTDVPWLSLTAGDVVNIYYRDTPYKTWFGLRAIGTAAAPVTINGVTNSSCVRPTISGDGAVPATDAKAAGFGSDIQGAGLIIIHRSPTDALASHKAAYIAIKNLTFTNARRGYSFKNYSGASVAYPTFSTGIYAVRVDRLLVENSEFVNNGVGIFTNSRGGSTIDFSSYITIRGNKFDLNGYDDSYYEHGLYVQGRRVLYEGNYIGQARAGSSLKDRSSGTVVRYNFVKASARALDLVETEEDVYQTGIRNLRDDPLYDYAWVYGNTIVNDYSSAYGSSIRLVHWGHDNDLTKSHQGKLYFFNNTVVHRGYNSSAWYVSLFQMGSNWGEVTSASTFGIDAWDNVFTSEGNAQGTVEWRAVWDLGTLNFKGVNFLPTNWKTKTSGTTATVNSTGSTVLTGAASILDSATFVPVSGAAILNRGNSYTPDYKVVSDKTTDFVAANVQPTAEFDLSGAVPAARSKVLNGTIDLGAFERR